MAQSGKSQSNEKKGRKKRDRASVVAEAEAFLASQKEKKRSSVRSVRYYWKNPITGVRKTHSKYRPRKSRVASKNASESGHSSAPLDVDTGGCSEEEHQNGTEDTSEDLDKILAECSAYAQSHPSAQQWNDRMINLNQSWANIRPKILKAVLDNEVLASSSLCAMCEEAQGCVRCHHCGLKTIMCIKCDKEVHKKSPLHDREIFHEGFFKPVSPTVSLDSSGDLIAISRYFPHNLVFVCTGCSANGHFEPILTDEKCIVVTADGRFDVNVCNFRCCDCQKIFSPLDLANLVNTGYWPGSIANTKYVFSQDVFLKWDIFQKRLPGSSESGFLRSMEDLSILRGRVGVINDSAFSIAFKEWKFCSHEVNLLQSKDFMECPTCAIYQHSAHVDGNAKLYRYKSAGRKKRGSYYGEKFILDNNKVDEHLANLYKNANQSKGASNSKCGESNWQAARNSLKKKKKLDETGLSISGCRHGIAQRAVNMFYGEVYGYAHYIQIADMIPRNVSFFWEDIVCKYWPWLTKKDPASASTMKPALSVMHGKAHSWSCQVLWGGWWQEGAARSTGEEVEQINSYVSRCGSTTKHMCPEGREELLTEHVIAWNRRKIFNLAEALSKRFLKVNKDIQRHSQELSELGNELGVDVSTNNLESWVTDVREHAKRLDKRSVSQASSSEQKAFDLQQKIEYTSFSISQRMRNFNRLADGSKPRHRLRSKISADKSDLTKVISEYNKLPTTVCPVDLDDMLQHKFPWETPDDNTQTPVRVKKLVVEKYLDGERLKEEKALLEREMTGFLKYYRDVIIPGIEARIAALSEVLPALCEEHTLDEATLPTASAGDLSAGRYRCPNDNATVVHGKIALARKGLNFAKAQIVRGVEMFRAVTKGEYAEFIDDLTAETRGVEDMEEESDSGEVEWEDISSDLSNQDIVAESVPIREQPVSVIDGDVCRWIFPAEFCQSSIDGRNGSNACSLISLAVTHSFLTSNSALPRPGTLSAEWIKHLHVCMLLGNAMYDNARQSLPHRYLTAAEAAQLFSDYASVKVGQAYPVRLEDPHPLSTLREQLRMLAMEKKRCAALFIYDNKTVSFLVCKDGSILFVDSHSHPPYGASVILTSTLNPSFFSSFSEIALLNCTTFGNFTRIEI